MFTGTQWNYFLNKRIENSLEVSLVKAEYNEALSKATILLIKYDLYRKELKKKWLNDPEILERLKKEYKTEKALKILKQSIK